MPLFVRTGTAALCVAIALAAVPSAADPAGNTRAWSRKAIDDVLRPVFINTMTDRYIAGAAVAVVKDGALVYAEGFRDREVFHEDPVDAGKTIFRYGSVTKVLTGIAVMQLVDAGQIGLDDDVDRHLQSLRVPAGFDEPVRVRHLLTHTAGFDQLGYGRHADGPADVLSLAEFLSGNLVRIRPPGRVAVYDTYGITLAGLLVEDVSGLTYESYLERRIFEPLGMERSGITVPAEFRDDVGIGYGFAGEWEVLPWEYMHTAPASTANGTVTDMARVMIALLDGGTYGDARILSRESADAMLRPQHTNHELLPGFGYTLWEDRRLGIPAMSHGGSMEGFGCLLYLVPSERMGVFVACNQGFFAPRLSDAVVSALIRAFLPHRIAEPSIAARREGADVMRVTGSYVNAMRNHTRPDRGGWTAEPFAVTASGDGAIVIDAKPAWPIVSAKNVFQREDGTLIVFQEGRDGDVVRMLIEQRVYERVAADEH